MNCLPFFGLKVKFEKWEVLFWRGGTPRRRVARRSIYSPGARGKVVAKRLGLSRAVVEQWLLTCRAVGSKALLAMGPRTGNTVLKPKSRWRASSSTLERPSQRSWLSSGQRRGCCARLVLEVLRRRSWACCPGEGGGRSRAFGTLSPVRPAGMHRAYQVDILLRVRASQEADQIGVLGGRRRDLFAQRQRLRVPADSHVPARGKERTYRRQDRAQDDARDGESCCIRCET